MSEINIDKSMIQSEVELSHKEEKFVEMSNGCICCTLREDLLLEVTKLAEQKSLINSDRVYGNFRANACGKPLHLKMKMEYLFLMWPD